MNVTTQLLWALWISAGGYVNSGLLSDPKPVAYFQTLEQCEAVRAAVTANLIPNGYRSTGKEPNNAATCIRAEYVIK